MVEIITKERTNHEQKDPQVRDLSRVVDQTSRTLQELDQRLHLMRNDLAQLIQTTAGFAAMWSGARGAMMRSPVEAGPSWAPWGTPGGVAQRPGAGTGPVGAPWDQMGQHAGPLSVPSSTTEFSRDLRDRPTVLHQPRADVIDAGQGFEIDLDLPGVDKDNVDIMVAERSVIVKAISRPQGGDGVVVLGERNPIEYRRTIQLPSEIQTGECKATLKDGLLRIEVPKRIPTEGPRHINVAYT